MLGPISITGRQSAYHEAGQLIAGVGHLSGYPLYHLPSRDRESSGKRGDLRAFRGSDCSRADSERAEPPFSLAGQLSRIPDIFACFGLIDRRAQIACSMLRCRRTEAGNAKRATRPSEYHPEPIDTEA
jgi:hypothetical protein